MSADRGALAKRVASSSAGLDRSERSSISLATRPADAEHNYGTAGRRHRGVFGMPLREAIIDTNPEIELRRLRLREVAGRLLRLPPRQVRERLLDQA
jgi:hypothetical protein